LTVGFVRQRNHTTPVNALLFVHQTALKTRSLKTSLQLSIHSDRWLRVCCRAWASLRRQSTLAPLVRSNYQSIVTS